MAAKTTAPISNVQYEDFTPKSEWKEENGTEEQTVREEEDIGKKRKESSSSPTVAPPGIDTEGVKKRKESSSTMGTIKEDKMKEVKSMAAAAKEAVKGRLGMEMSDDRQRLVNVGVAVLVVAALRAYLYYTYSPSLPRIGQEK